MEYRDRRQYLVAFLRGCAQAADSNELGVELGRLLVNGDLMKEAADLLEKDDIVQVRKRTEDNKQSESKTM